MGDEGRGPPPKVSGYAGPPRVRFQSRLVLKRRDPVDAMAIKAWTAHLAELGRDDLVRAANEAMEITVRGRWPEPDTPLPKIPIDFRKRASDAEWGN
jgi:hypothetical protein